MKSNLAVLIFCAGQEDYNNNLPAPLMQTKDQFTNIEHIITSLQELGVLSHSIYLIISEKSKYAASYVNKATELNINLIKLAISSENSATSLYLALDILKATSNHFLLINGNTLVNEGKLNSAICSKGNNLMVVRPEYADSKSVHIKYDEKRRNLRASSDYRKIPLPRFEYAGVAKVNSEVLSQKFFMTKPPTDISYVEWLTQSGADISLVNINALQSKKLIGGSFASLNSRTVVRKSAKDQGVEKIINEIEWLETFSDLVPGVFPEVVSKKISEDHAWFEMPFYPLQSLRSLLMTGELSPKEATAIMSSIMELMFEKIYTRETEKFTFEHFIEIHLKRFLDRIDTASDDPFFNSIRNQDVISVNGKKLPTWKTEREWLTQNAEKFYEKYSPHSLCVIHGDLHLQNILIDTTNNNFILADPRGDLNGSDISYDLGKILHSVNGLYDFIHTDQYTLKRCSSSEIDYCWSNPNAVERFREALPLFTNVLDEFQNKTSMINWYEKARFSELMHFATLTPFHLHKDDEGRNSRATMLYLRSLELLQDFKEDFC